MRRKIVIPLVIPLLVLPLLAGCVGSDYLVASAPTDPSVLEEATSLREGEPHYTSRRAGAVQPELVRIAIDDKFTMYERAKILRAVNEWNHVLNGFVRFDIGPAMDGSQSATGQLQSWLIVPTHGGRPPPAQGVVVGHALAVTQPLRPIGGMVIVYVDRLGGRDLAGVMRHELGHVLGLGHDSHGRLMSARYTASNQQCIDRAAAEAIAANRRLPAAELNWCEAPNVARAGDRPLPQAANRAAH